MELAAGGGLVSSEARNKTRKQREDKGGKAERRTTSKEIRKQTEWI